MSALRFKLSKFPDYFTSIKQLPYCQHKFYTLSYIVLELYEFYYKSTNVLRE